MAHVVRGRYTRRNEETKKKEGRAKNEEEKGREREERRNEEFHSPLLPPSFLNGRCCSSFCDLADRPRSLTAMGQGAQADDVTAQFKKGSPITDEEMNKRGNNEIGAGNVAPDEETMKLERTTWPQTCSCNMKK
jgi:hypothetical protein